MTTNPADDSDPLWSPDGRRLLFSSNRAGPADVYERASNAALAETLVFETPGATYTTSWHPDGQTVAVIRSSIGDVSTFRLDDLTLRDASAGSDTQLEMLYAPDGRHFSYASDETGQYEIYVEPWPQNGDRWQVSTAGGTDARWNPDGSEIFYLTPTRELMAVGVNTKAAFSSAAPTRLFQSRVAGPLGSGHRFPYAVSRDGQRFLMYVTDVETRPAIEATTNWLALLTAVE